MINEYCPLDKFNYFNLYISAVYDKGFQLGFRICSQIVTETSYALPEICSTFCLFLIHSTLRNTDHNQADTDREIGDLKIKW